jgi:hypothetical protein
MRAIRRPAASPQAGPVPEVRLRAASRRPVERREAAQLTVERARGARGTSTAVVRPWEAAARPLAGVAVASRPPAGRLVEPGARLVTAAPDPSLRAAPQEPRRGRRRLGEAVVRFRGLCSEVAPTATCARARLPTMATPVRRRSPVVPFKGLPAWSRAAVRSMAGLAAKISATAREGNVRRERRSRGRRQPSEWTRSPPPASRPETRAFAATRAATLLRRSLDPRGS